MDPREVPVGENKGFFFLLLFCVVVVHGRFYVADTRSWYCRPAHTHTHTHTHNTRTWSDLGGTGDVEAAHSKDVLLTNVSAVGSVSKYYAHENAFAS